LIFIVFLGLRATIQAPRVVSILANARELGGFAEMWGCDKSAVFGCVCWDQLGRTRLPAANQNVLVRVYKQKYSITYFEK
jgi:hypothetical protein